MIVWKGEVTVRPYQTEKIEAPELNVVDAVRMLFENEPASKFVLIDLSASGDWRCILLEDESKTKYAVYATQFEASAAIGILRSLMKKPSDVVITTIVDIDHDVLLNTKCHPTMF